VLLEGHAASPVQTAGVLHLAPVHDPLTAQTPSFAHASAAHLAPPHTWLDVHVASAPHAGATPQVAPLQTLLAVQAESALHAPTADAVQVAPPQTPVDVPQFASALHVADVHTCVAMLQTPPTAPHCAFVEQVPVHVPFSEPPAPEPQTPLSQSVVLWQAVATPVEHVPFTPPPQFAPSQSVFAWHACPVLLLQTPPPHELLSHVAAEWHVWALVLHAPIVDPVPVPHELLSQSPFL
jgi:hypothetical protein